MLRLPRPPQRPLMRLHFEPYVTHVPLSYLALRRGSFDLAHALYPADALAAARWARRSGGASVLSYMGVPTREWLEQGRMRLDILQRAVDRCDAVVALSAHAAEEFARSIGYRARVIPPGVDLHTFRPLPARAERPTIVCAAASDEPRKNVALLVRAFALVRERYPDARLVLSRSRRAAASLSGPGSVPGLEWANLDDRPALARAYGEAWAAALPAVDEAFGLVLVEALACGTPVVGYDHSAIPEIVDRSTIGRLFGRLEPDALAAALIETFELAGDPATARHCRARAEEFSRDRCTEAYLALYRDLLG